MVFYQSINEAIEARRNPNVKFGRKAEMLSNDSVEISWWKGQMGMKTVDGTI